MEPRHFDDFDDFAKDYRNLHTENIQLSGADSFYFAEMKVKLLRQFERDTTLTVLDIGCGDGTTAFYMHQYFLSWQINGIDISEKSIEEAINKNVANTTFSIYNGKQIPFPDESFDIIFMAGVLHHINFKEHPSLVKEINRVLKKGKNFYLFEHNPLNPVTRHLVNTCVFDKNVRLLKNGYAKKILCKNNFTIIVNQFIIFFPRKGIFKKLLFLEKFFKFIPFGGQYFIQSTKS